MNTIVSNGTTSIYNYYTYNRIYVAIYIVRYTYVNIILVKHLN